MIVKRIRTVPSSVDIVNISLSEIQRRTPSVIRRREGQANIRKFYTRKVAFAGEVFCERLENIVKEFPRVEELHPFFSDLINVLYDKDHYKLALNQINIAQKLVRSVCKEYSRLLKYGDSLYRCKQLKKSAFGRMVTIVKKNKEVLSYLEEVRRHFLRLPSIDPNTRTLIVCGYPNVGKSNFMNSITRANVDVQPYAFTTKSLYVGHSDYKYLRWQIIDTPGILDRPLSDMNTIEMQSITALAHLEAAILYIFDPSESCGYSMDQQLSLFKSIWPLFKSKPVVLVMNKSDIFKFDNLNDKIKSELLSLSSETSGIIDMSSLTGEGVIKVRNFACDALLALRTETKLNSGIVAEQKIYPVVPNSWDIEKRPPSIPIQKNTQDIPNESQDTNVPIPEIFNGKNIADFISKNTNTLFQDILRKEDVLEKEKFEEKLELIKSTIKAATEIKHATHLLDQKKRVTPSWCVPRSRIKKTSEIVAVAPCKKDEKSQSLVGYGTKEVKKKAQALQLRALKNLQRIGRRNDKDKKIVSMRPKHLFSGKRKKGTHAWR